MADETGDDRTHDVLFSEATYRLGEIHGLILKSRNVMDEVRWTEKKSDIGSTYEFTELGNQIGQDEIHWWIFEREKDVDQLYELTVEALAAAQRLMRASEKLKTREPESYKDLLVSLREFAEKHLKEITRLHNYAVALEKRDPMAPRILFTYRVWGSTRMGDRDLSITDYSPEKLSQSMLQPLTEIVLGLRSRGSLTYEDKANEISFEIYESLDPETTSNDYVIVPPIKRVVRRTARAAYDNCATYFLEIRDSLRNIELDIHKFKQQGEIYKSDNFWREFIDKAQRSKMAETDLWDFKETINVWHAPTGPARRAAKITFAEDVASFANVSGGVLIVGVNDRRELVGIGAGRDLENRLKVAKNVLSEMLKYKRDLVSFRQVAMGDQRDIICLVIVISQANSAVGVSDGEGKYSYPVRRETGIERVDRDDTPSQKSYRKTESREFLVNLKQFMKDN